MIDLIIQANNGQTKLAISAGILTEVGSLLQQALRGGMSGDSPGESKIHVAIITDENVGPLYEAQVVASLADSEFKTSVHIIEPGESSKRIEVLNELYQFFAEIALGRDGVVLALGGGVVSDLAGLAAATWMRGVGFAICPTTLEADIDASVGGKTAINIPGGKNLVGAFHQPRLVAIDPICLNSLDPRDVCAGLAESVKHAMIASEEFLAWHEVNAEAILTLDENILPELILRNVKIKAAFVEADAKEQTGKRMMLNFGHTIGHAIEDCCGYTLRHGECVALGMLAACRLSQRIGVLNASIVERMETLLKQFQLPTKLEEAYDPDKILSVIQNDKKKRASVVRFVLLEGIGRPVIRDDVSESQMKEAYESLI